MQTIKDFMLDAETAGYAPDGAVVDMAVLTFVNDPHAPPTFKELCDSAIRVKFNLSDQKGTRVFDKEVIDWWRTQDEEARKHLRVSPEDVSIIEGVARIESFLKESGVDPWKSQGFCRGMSFDFPIMQNILQQVSGLRDTFKLDWCKFWNQRDTRTFIEATLMTRGMTECPLPKGTLTGFVKHNSVHDIARDCLMVIYSQRYALGLEDAPTQEEADPHSIKQKRT